MPALTGLLLSIPLGQFLQKKTNIVPWFSLARLLVIASYALTGFTTFAFRDRPAILAILAVWALATIPQTLLSISFSVVMNSVAGPTGRYELMTRRWSILGLTTAFMVILAGQILDHNVFPINYQIVFIILSVGGLVSYYFSSHIRLPDVEPRQFQSRSLFKQMKEYVSLVRQEKAFVSFVLKRFVFLTGQTLAAPLYPVFFVRILHAPDSWIATISTAQTAILIVGYFLWTVQTRRRGSRNVLLLTTFGISLYPLMISFTHVIWPVVIFAGLAGIFQAGINLVFFDELMKTVPEPLSATFVAAAQSLQYLSSIVAPFIGTYMADHYGFSPALIASCVVSLCGFALFFFEKPHLVTVHAPS
jgi:Na+/melibiose symporter-like transporter